MEEIKKYEYTLDNVEVLEFCRAASWEQLKNRKRIWVVVMAICLLELFFMPQGMRAQFVVWNAVLIGFFFLISIFTTYAVVKKSVLGQHWMIWIEGGKLMVNRGDCSEVPCSSIQRIHVTRHLLMLGFFQTAQQLAWFIVPLRVFADEQERQYFLDRIQRPQAAADDAAGTIQSENAQSQEILHFTYMLDADRWLHLQRGMVEAVNSGVLGKAPRARRMILYGGFTMAVVFLFTYWVIGYASLIMLMYSLLTALLITLNRFGRNPEKALRKQIAAPVLKERVCGVWQISLTEAGIAVTLPRQTVNFYQWESMGWLVETEDAFYIVHKDKKIYVAIAKESVQTWDQVHALYALCAQKGIKKVQGKKGNYMPNWAFGVLFVLFIILSIAFFVMVEIGNRMKDLRQDIQQRAEVQYEEREFDPADYPKYVPLDEQAEVLKSLGIDVPQQTVASLGEWMTAHDLQSSIEGYPYTYLLTELGTPEYDDDGVVTGYPKDVFWFDFEGYDISTDYINILDGMLALAEGSSLDSVRDIRENTTTVEWERGRGTITISMFWNGQTYWWDMDMYYDWIDEDILGVLNELLIESKSDKLFWTAEDNGQGALVFFCTSEWAEAFMDETGLELAHYTTRADGQENFTVRRQGR